MRKDDSGLEDELEYFHDVMPPPEEEGAVEVKWWSPGPQELQSEEENEEENKNLINLLTDGLRTGSNDSELVQSPTGAATAPAACDHRALEEGPEEGEGSPQDDVPGNGLPAEKGSKRRVLRKKEVCSEQERWEATRRGAWLRELLTDSSEDEPEDECTRFKDSSMWIAEMTGGATEPSPEGSGDASSEDFEEGTANTPARWPGGQKGGEPTAPHEALKQRLRVEMEGIVCSTQGKSLKV
jgi:hypothetical protein